MMFGFHNLYDLNSGAILALPHQPSVSTYYNLKEIVADILKVSPIFERLIMNDDSTAAGPRQHSDYVDVVNAAKPELDNHPNVAPYARTTNDLAMQPRPQPGNRETIQGPYSHGPMLAHNAGYTAANTIAREPQPQARNQADPQDSESHDTMFVTNAEIAVPVDKGALHPWPNQVELCKPIPEQPNAPHADIAPGGRKRFTDAHLGAYAQISGTVKGSNEILPKPSLHNAPSTNASVKLPKPVAKPITSTLASAKRMTPSQPPHDPLNQPRERKTTDRRRPETPIQSFLKEAKRVMPSSIPKRTPSGSQKQTNHPTARLTSTPGVNSAQAHSIALSNMFAALETIDNDQKHESVEKQVEKQVQNNQIDITSPEQFPSLPRKPPINVAPPPAYEPPANNLPRIDVPNEQSWVEVDEEDNKTIEAFLASVENSDIPTNAQRNGPPDVNVIKPPRDNTGQAGPRPPTMAPQGAVAHPYPDVRPSYDPGRTNSAMNNQKNDAPRGALSGPPKTTPHDLAPNVGPFGTRNPVSNPSSMAQQGAAGGAARPPNGARPKYSQNMANQRNNNTGPPRPQRGVNNALNHKQSGANQNMDDPVRNHPERVVNRNGWHTGSKKRKRTKSSSLTFPTISGGHTKPYRDVFVRNLTIDSYNGPEEMADALQDYCEERGVGVYFIKILNSQFEGYANVKLTIDTCDFETVMDNDFWPDNVSARVWYTGNDKKGPNQSPGY